MSQPLFLDNCTLIDATAPQARPGMAVAIEGDRIQAVCPASGLRPKPYHHRIDLNGAALLPGMWADICVFDPDRIAHMATYFEPRQYCVGIEYVLVNGGFALEEGKLTEALAGQVLSHKAT